MLRWRYNRSLDFFVDDDDAPDEKANELCVALVQVRTAPREWYRVAAHRMSPGGVCAAARLDRRAAGRAHL